MPKTAAPRPTIAKRFGRGKPADLVRCRLRTACDGTTDDLALRRILVESAVAPTLCCPACAEGRTA